MVLWVAIVLGIVQGIFMFFPVSSTSHLALAQHFFIWTGQDMPSPDSAEMILFDLIVHVGTLVSIAVVFRNSLAKFLRDAINGFLATLRMKPSSKDLLFVKLSLLGLFSVAVTGIIGYPMKSQFENVFAHPLLMSLTLVITGLLNTVSLSHFQQSLGQPYCRLWRLLVMGAKLQLDFQLLQPDLLYQRLSVLQPCISLFICFIRQNSVFFPTMFGVWRSESSYLI